jgi:hypothetical protein
MMPPAVFSSAVRRRSTTRSCKGRKFDIGHSSTCLSDPATLSKRRRLEIIEH